MGAQIRLILPWTLLSSVINLKVGGETMLMSYVTVTLSRVRLSFTLAEIFLE